MHVPFLDFYQKAIVGTIYKHLRKLCTKMNIPLQMPTKRIRGGKAIVVRDKKNNNFAPDTAGSKWRQIHDTLN